jgi:hypothetical protein
VSLQRALTSAIRSAIAEPVVRLVALSRLVTLISAPVTLFLIATTTSPAEQGFYFVFVNVQAIASLFELGVGTMLVQFAAHASSGWHWAASGQPAGDPARIESLFSVMNNAQRWFSIAALVLVALLLPTGIHFFGPEAARNGVAYIVPWIVVTIALAGYLTIVPLLCTLEGSGQLPRLQRMRLVQAIGTAATLWVLIPVAGGLIAVAAASLVQLATAAAWLVLSFPGFVRRATRGVAGPTQRERASGLAKAQSRSAAAWIVGFLGPQLLSPIIFREVGAEAGGQSGLTMAAASAPLMIALAWLQARYPEYGVLVARRDIARLDAISKRATLQALGVCVTLSLLLIAVVRALGRFETVLASRFLPLREVLLLCGTSVAYLLYHSMAARLRAHREESLLWPLMLGTLVTVVATAAAAPRGATPAVAAYSSGVIGVLLPTSALAFLRRRRALHVDCAAEHDTARSLAGTTPVENEMLECEKPRSDEGP